LGGATTADLNFAISKDGVFPLQVAAAHGKYSYSHVITLLNSLEILNLVLSNPGLDVNKVDNYGVNAFWVAAYHNNVEVLLIL